MPAFGDAYSDAEIAAANYVSQSASAPGFAPDSGERRLAPARTVTDHLLADLFVAAIRRCD
jgi:hypothetical protein